MSDSHRRCRYHLRFQLIPGEDLEQNARDLAAFCLKHRVEEVVLFIAGEEWNNGPMSDADIEMWFETAKRAKELLEASGLSVSLNIWATTLHMDRGRRFPKERNFSPMVSPSGREAKATASFACPEWKKYISAVYGRFAELGFRISWIEDDFRYHNHGPLDWGGDFSPLMIQRFEKQTGIKTDRQTIVKNVLSSGKPHPWRREWLRTWRETQLEVARSIRDAVAASAPVESALGLMSSRLENHSIEGRDWTQLFESISISGRVAHRPHFAGYSDGNGRDLAESSAVLDMQKNVRPAGTIVEPEIENFPFTRFSKSDNYTWVHMALAQLHGSDALLLNLFPFYARTPLQCPEVGDLLDSSQQSLNWLAEHFPPSLQTQGIGVLWHPDASMYVHTERGTAMEELRVPMVNAARLLNQLGVAVQMRTSGVNVLFGKGAWAWKDIEMKEFLKQGLWLDAEAATILQERGFGQWIGVENKGWWGREDLNYSIEETADSVSGLPRGLHMTVNSFSRVANLQSSAKTTEWTSLLAADGRRLGTALATCKNDFGGRVAVSAFPLGSEDGAWTKSFQRQTLAQKLIQYLATPELEPVTVKGGAYLMPIDLARGRERRVVVLNGSPDPAKPMVRIPKAQHLKEVQLLKPLSKPRPVYAKETNWKNGITVELGSAIPYLGMAVFIAE